MISAHIESESNLTFECPTRDFELVTCLPVVFTEFKDFTTNGNEDALAFERLGGKILTSCEEVIIRVVDLRLSPIPQTCDDTLNQYRIFEIYDGDPTDPQVLPEKCTITYKSIVPINLMRVGGFPAETVISCEDDLNSAIQDFIDNFGYQDYFSCTDVSLRQMTPSVPQNTIQYDCPNNGFVRVQFKLMDECQYELETVANFRIKDDVSPEFSYCPLDLVIDLSDERIEIKIDSLLNAAEAFDNCSMTTIRTDYDPSMIDLVSCDPLQEVVINYIAFDECDNSVNNCSARLTLTNLSEPEIICPDTLVLECKDPMDSLIIGNWIAEISALDFKKDVIAPEFIQNDFNEVWLEQTYCDDGFGVTFTATDPCNVTKTCRSYINFVDTQQPDILSCPADTTILADNTNAVTEVNDWLLSFRAEDQCNPAINTRADFDFDDLDYSCGDREIEVHFIVDDQCNPIDSTLCVSTLSIIDNVVSNFVSFPADTTINCERPVNTMAIETWLRQAKAVNNLDQDFTILTDFDNLDPKWNVCDGIVTIELSYEDQCQRQFTQLANVTIIDTKAPTLICPETTVFMGEFNELQAEITAWLGSGTVNDNCNIDRTNWDYSTTRFDPCSERDTQIVTFFTIDECDNRSDACSSELIIEADKQPEIICPTELVIECGNPDNDQLILDWLNSATGMDFSANPLIPQDDYLKQNLDFITCFDTLKVNFSIIDNCGTNKTCSEYIRIEDSTDPEIECPDNITIASTQNNIDISLEAWVASTNFSDHGCFQPSLTTDLDLTTLDLCETDEDLIITFTVTDDCGATSTCEATIELDNSDPQITCPDLLELECGDPNNLQNIVSALESTITTDNSGLPLTPIFDDNILIDPTCDTSFLVLIEVIDACNHQSFCNAVVSVIDTQEPIVDCPDNLNLLSGDPDKEAKFNFWMALISVQDCNEYALTNNFDTGSFVVDCEDDLIDIEIYVTDECGLSTTCQASLIISNNVTTTFVNCEPSNNLTLECGDPNNEDLINQWIDSVSAEDNLGNNFSLSAAYDINDAAFSSCSGEVEVEFTLVDFCSTSNSCSLNILLSDNESPSITCPDEVDFVLEDTNFETEVQAWINTVILEDNCDQNPTFTHSYNSITELPDCIIEQTFTIEFEVEDHCGYTNDCEAMLTVTTEAAPSLSCPDGDSLVLECGDPNNEDLINDLIQTAAAIDADGSDLVIQSNWDPSLINSFDCTGEIPIELTTDDNCGNSLSCMFTVMLEDTNDPEAFCPDDLTVFSTDVQGIDLIEDWLLNFIAVDACTMPSSQLTEINLLDGLCELAELSEVMLYAEDACGLSATCSAMLIIDKSGPELTCPGPLRVQCGFEEDIEIINEWLNTVTGTDNAGNVLDATNELDLGNFTNSCLETVDVVFTVRDACRATQSCSQQIMQIDSLAPDIIVCPTDITLDLKLANLEAEIADWLAEFEAIDLCTDSVRISNDYDLVIGANKCGTEQEVFFDAEDICGNINTTCQSHISLVNALEVDLICPEPTTIKCGDGLTNGLVVEFINSYTPNSVEDFAVTNNLDTETLDLSCTEAYNLEVILTLTDICNNIATCKTSIDFIPSASLYIPNTFSPRLSGDDRYFAVRGNESITMISSFRIYGRWGDLIHERIDFDPRNERGWDGRGQNGNFEQGVYTYVIQYTDIFGNEYEHLGNVTLLY